MDVNRKMRVLVVTYLPWRDDISVGNTLSNIFCGMDDRIEFANIYFRSSKPNNILANRYFCISEKELAKSILTRKPVGKEVLVENPLDTSREQFSNSYNKARQMRFEVFLLAQDIIGILGNWRSKNLDEFVSDFRPDLIFGPLGRVPVSNNLMTYLNCKFKIPIVTYAWDDHYSLKKMSFSPFFWIKTFVERQAIRKCAMCSDLIYTITEQMKYEYSSCFRKPCKVLYKGYNFKENMYINKEIKYPIKIIYMGNIGAGRWKVLSKIASSIEKFNQTEKVAELNIYTLTPINKEIEKKLNVGESAKLMSPVLTNRVMETMLSADILLHVEPTGLKEQLFFRLSFSTKLVDYFYTATCILALGGSTAAMNYLIKNDAAVVQLNMDVIEQTLYDLLTDKNRIRSYGEKAWDCGARNHQISVIQNSLFEDFCNIIS